jgi:hypothetical protein
VVDEALKLETDPAVKKPENSLLIGKKGSMNQNIAAKPNFMVDR